ncbi:tRNA methyltransferase 10 homolog B isoform X1 [Strigops habroptila]|uniref:tRNA methyltransferase 10 homolog B isoform X1 n=1 Tax=Strigops habroptila TaxID=2489341 RepID=UPI0011CFB891|nr:tRNA methyltransferase 10 homolog B isoform X1 [Strigops habroptila]
MCCGSGGAGSACWLPRRGRGSRNGRGAEPGGLRAQVRGGTARYGTFTVRSGPVEGLLAERTGSGPWLCGPAGTRAALSLFCLPGAASRGDGRAPAALAKERLLQARTSGPRLCVDLGVADRMTEKPARGFLTGCTPNSPGFLEAVELCSTGTAFPEPQRAAGDSGIMDVCSPRVEPCYPLTLDLWVTVLVIYWKETSRLASQIRRLYGANRRAEKPFWLCLTEFVVGSLIYEECFRMNDGFSNYLIDTTQESYLDLFPLDAIVYLTPDSENVLEDIDPNKVYILGGLVDESIHKKLTLQRAQEQSLQTARLPIREYMVKAVNTKNYHSETLAINQVFDILSTYYETRSWPAALKAGVSSGKGYVLPEAVK